MKWNATEQSQSLKGGKRYPHQQNLKRDLTINEFLKSSYLQIGNVKGWPLSRNVAMFVRTVGKIQCKQWSLFCNLWNNLRSTFSSSSSKVDSFLQYLLQFALHNNLLTLERSCTLTNPPHADKAYIIRDKIMALNTASSEPAGNPLRCKDRKTYILCEHWRIMKSICSAKRN